MAVAPSASGDRPEPSPLRIGFESAIAAAAVVVALLLSSALQPVELLFPGSRGDAPEVLVADFGRELPDRHAYDGQDAYLVARTLPDLAAAHDLGIPEYRLRRVLHPALGALAPPGVPTLTLMVLANIVGIGLAAGALADLCRQYGQDPRAGYAAAVALAFSLIITTTEPLAFGLGLLGLAAVERSRLVWATVFFGLAGLTRETALVMAIAAGIALVLRRRPLAALGLTVGAFAPFLGWWAYVRSQVPADIYQSSKLLGVFDADLTRVDIAASAVVVTLLFVGAWRWRRQPLLGLTAFGYLACCALYIGDQFQAHGLPRVSAAGIAVSLAGLATWRGSRVAPSAVPAAR